MKPIVSLQCMRAVAAILVVFYHHMNTMRDGPAPSMPSFDSGQFGVDIFFIISGFIMWTTTTEKTVGVQFMLRRIVRIVPLYWTLTLVTAFISTDHGLALVQPDYLRLLKSLFFIPQWHQTYPMIAPYMLVGWTLELEMLFYVIFAGGLYFARARRVVAVPAILIAIAVAGLLFHPHTAVLKGYTNDIIIEFGMGIVLGRLYEKERAPQSPFIGAALIVTSILLVSIHRELMEWRFLYFGAPAFMLMTGILALESRLNNRVWRIPKFLGDASYSIYLTHLMAMAISTKLVPSSFAAHHPVPVLLIEVAFAVASGCAAYMVIERPLTAGARRLIAPRARPTEILKGM